MPEIGKIIKMRRRAKNVTQDDMAAKLKLNRTTYAAKEQRGNFSEVELKKVKEVLGISDAMLELNPIQSKDDIPFILNGVIRLEASVRVILRGLAEIHAHQKDQPATKILSDYTNAVRQEIAIIREEWK